MHTPLCPPPPQLRADASPRTCKAGFSLIEVLAVLAVMALMTGVVVARLPDTQDVTVENLTEQLAWLDLQARKHAPCELSLENNRLRLTGEDGIELASLALPAGWHTQWWQQNGETVLRYDTNGAEGAFALQVRMRQFPQWCLLHARTGQIVWLDTDITPAVYLTPPAGGEL